MMLVVPLALAFLATVDTACVGYRVAAGRNALIRKQRYYRRAMLRGALIGQVAIGIALAVLGVLVAGASDARQLVADLATAGFAMLRVYAPYAALIAIGLAFRLLRSVDVRCLTSTLIFGPLVLVRPLVAVAGGVAAVVAAPRPAIAVLVGLVLAMMLGLEPVLNWSAGQAERRARAKPVA
jgi:hypothetical protein